MCHSLLELKLKDYLQEGIRVNMRPTSAPGKECLQPSLFVQFLNTLFCFVFLTPFKALMHNFFPIDDNYVPVDMKSCICSCVIQANTLVSSKLIETFSL